MAPLPACSRERQQQGRRAARGAAWGRLRAASGCAAQVSGEPSRGATRRFSFCFCCFLLLHRHHPQHPTCRLTQGLQCWVPLRASSSYPVAAVQVAACLTSLGALSATACGDVLLLQRSAEAAALLPPLLQAQLLAAPGAGFAGQPAVLALGLDLLVPPSSGSNGGRPKADRFFCRYSLPGGSGEHATAPRVLTSVGGSGTVLAAGGARKSPTGPAAPGVGHQWAAKLNHAAFYEVRGQGSPAAAQAPCRR